MTDSGDDNHCDLCKGTAKNSFNQSCTYCNGTGEWNQAAQSYVKNHICQCIMWDRNFCPVCRQKCHHDSSLNPKQVIDPGYGGLGAAKHSVVVPEEEEEIEEKREEVEIVA